MGIQRKVINGKTYYEAWYYSPRKRFTSLSAARKHEDKMKAEKKAADKKKSSSSSSSKKSSSSGSSSSKSSSSGSGHKEPDRGNTGSGSGDEAGKVFRSANGALTFVKQSYYNANKEEFQGKPGVHIIDDASYNINPNEGSYQRASGSGTRWSFVHKNGSSSTTNASSYSEAKRYFQNKYSDREWYFANPITADTPRFDGYSNSASQSLFGKNSQPPYSTQIVDPSNPGRSDRIINGTRMTWIQAANWGNAGWPSDTEAWLAFYTSNGATYPGGSGGSSGGSGSGSGSGGGNSGNPGTGTFDQYDSSSLEATAEFQALSEEDQAAVLSVFGAIAGNDKTQADRLAKAFEAASKINDPYFGQQLRLAVDAIERGYVAIDEEAAFQEQQIASRLSDFREDFQRKKDFMTLEQAAVMKEIDRDYSQQLEGLQNNLAASGFGSSSRKAKQVGLLDEATGDLRESRNRRFSFERETDEANFAREERDTQRELTRLERITRENKLDFLRTGEQQVGTSNLPNLPGAPDPLGDIYGKIPSDKIQNTISAATSFVF